MCRVLLWGQPTNNKGTYDSCLFCLQAESFPTCKKPVLSYTAGNYEDYF